MALITFENLPSTNTPLNAENLNNNFNELLNEINDIKNRNIYSTNEIKTNKIWTDGKPIYRKIYTYSQSATSNWTPIDFSTIGLFNIDYIYFANGSRKIESSNYVRDYDYSQNVYIDTSMSKLQIGPTENPQQFTFVFEYTKTTD